MERDLAEQLLKKLQTLDGPIADLVELIEQIADKDEKISYRQGIGELMSHITGLNYPLVKQYPELDPLKD